MTVTDKMTTAGTVWPGARIEDSYSKNAWRGVNYAHGRTLAEVAHLVRFELKARLPQHIFSVSTRRHTLLHVRLTETNANIFAPVNVEALPERMMWNWPDKDARKQSLLKVWAHDVQNGVLELNSYRIDEDYRLTQEGKELFSEVVNVVRSFLWDDSDSQTDYFDVNFYYDVSVGSAKRPMRIRQPKAPRRSKKVGVWSIASY